jgi:toxin ParE1/3/4
VAEPKRPVLWSREAVEDIGQIWDYYVRVAGSRTADNILREIGKAIVLIEEHPFAGRSRDEVRASLRSVAVSPHVIFYRIANDRPEIVRILDGRQDIDEIFVDSGTITPPE